MTHVGLKSLHFGKTASPFLPGWCSCVLSCPGCISELLQAIQQWLSSYQLCSIAHDSPLTVMKTGKEAVGYGEDVPRDVAWKMPRGTSLTCRMVSPDCQGDWIWKRLVSYTSAVAERFPQRSNWKGKASVMMNCDSPWAEIWQSKRGVCAWGWASRGPDRLRPCFNHHKLCHAFLAIMD